MSIARTDATGEEGMLPELVRWSSSYALDRALVREDLLGSAAHVTMLAKTGLVSREHASSIRTELSAMFDAAAKNELALPEGEEDIHMAVESELGRRLGVTAGYVHAARSRNDQIALDTRLNIREWTSVSLGHLSAVIGDICDRADRERETLVAAYTHRQRAQPISVAFLLCAWGTSLARAGKLLLAALDSVDELPLGSGACSGTSLPIDRAFVAKLLGFSRVSQNALDTVSSRDAVLDYTWAASRTLLALGRASADLVDFSSSEFGFVELSGRISAGSSMMPQKKNPDVFELLRGKSARGVGNLMQMLTLMKGLPTGYFRDLQEDRQTVLETGPLLAGSLEMFAHVLPHVTFRADRTRASVADGFTQATDLAEALVKKGIPFREAYKAVGAAVADCVARGATLASLDATTAKRFHGAIDAEALRVLDPEIAVRAKESLGGTGPTSVAHQIESLRADARILSANPPPSLSALMAGLPAL